MKSNPKLVVIIWIIAIAVVILAARKSFAETPIEALVKALNEKTEQVGVNNNNPSPFYDVIPGSANEPTTEIHKIIIEPVENYPSRHYYGLSEGERARAIAFDSMSKALENAK